MQVELLTHTPDPVGICARAASICYNSTPRTEVVKGCIRRGHESIIEHASFTFYISGVSRSLLAQLTRHRIGWSFSVRSQRYCSEEGFVPVLPESLAISRDKKTDDPADADCRAREVFDKCMAEVNKAYGQLIALGIPREDARYILPNACPTEMVATVNARALRHFLRLRLDKRAQWEIRDMAGRMLALAREAAPELFFDFEQGAIP